MSPQNIVKRPGGNLLASAQAAGKGPPPVHLWNPPYCGEMDLRIARDGTWFHEGTPIGRPALVRLFAGILKREEGRYFLVSPVEKVGITVEDLPFIATDIQAEGEGAAQSVWFVTNVGDRVLAGPENPLRVDRDPETGEPSPSVMVRAGLAARIDRKTFYRMVDLCREERVDGAAWFGLHSAGRFFPIIPAAELP